MLKDAKILLTVSKKEKRTEFLKSSDYSCKTRAISFFK